MMVLHQLSCWGVQPAGRLLLLMLLLVMCVQAPAPVKLSL
jgi:uncharacterized integral membrane protein